jgi:hypothetical protein
MARDKDGIPFHPPEYNPDFPRLKCKECGLMNSCSHGQIDMEPWYPRLPILLDGGMVESIDDFNLSEYTEWSLQAIVDAEINKNNGMIVMQNFIHPVLYTRCIDAWPKDMDTIDVKGRLQKDILCNTVFATLFMTVLNDEYVKCAIADKFGLQEQYNVDCWLWQDSEEFTVNDVHVDYKEFDITFGLYMPQDNSIINYGTQFWKPDFEADIDESLLREDCILLKQLPFQHNLCYIMPRSKYSWHSSPILDKPMRRNHVYGNYKAI